jgi:hypothetical protein
MGLRISEYFLGFVVAGAEMSRTQYFVYLLISSVEPMLMILIMFLWIAVGLNCDRAED